MKKISIVILLCITCFVAKSQLIGTFDVGYDRGVAVVYFKLTNTTNYTMFNLTATAKNYVNGEEKSWNIPQLKSGSSIFFGTKDGWVWLTGERLIVTDVKGNTRYWICPRY